MPSPYSKILIFEKLRYDSWNHSIDTNYEEM